MVGSQRSRYLAYLATSNAIVHRKSAFAFSCGCFAETGTAGTGRTRSLKGSAFQFHRTLFARSNPDQDTSQQLVMFLPDA
jgi:hypothetical protein